MSTQVIKESELVEIGKKLLIIQPKPVQDTYEEECWKQHEPMELYNVNT